MPGLEGPVPVVDTPAEAGELVPPPATQPKPLITWLPAKVRPFLDKANRKFPLFLCAQVLAFIAVMSWSLLLPIRLATINDNDLGWHLRSGEWIVQHHQLPLTDPFSITGGTAPWVAYSWPFSVLIYEVAHNFDLQGIATYSAILWVATVLTCFILFRGQGAGYWRALLLTLISGNIVLRVLSPRPGTFTVLFCILLLHVLLRQRAKNYTKGIWVVPLLLWAWAAVHVQFVYGLFILGLFCLEPVLDRFFLFGERPQPFSFRLWAVTAISFAATLLNPYGFGPYRVIIDFLHQPFLARFVEETSAMSFTLEPHYITLFVTLGGAFALARRKPVRPLWVILLMWSAFCAFRMERDIWLVTTIACAIIASPRPEAEATTAKPVSRRVWVYGSVGILLVVVYSIHILPSNKQMLSLISIRMPLGAVAYIHEHHLTGPIFNDYNWGGFLIYAIPEIPVCIDGRTNVHGQDEVGRSMNTWALHPGWDRDPFLNNAHLVIGPPGAPLIVHLRTDPHFKLLYDDGVGVLLERTSPARVPSGEAPNEKKDSK